jgi:bacillithiol system protein YtxJ
VKKLFEKEYITGEMKMKTYLLDVINNKLISQLIEKTFEVIHQSPQIIIVSNLKPVYTASHGRVLYSEIKKYSN